MAEFIATVQFEFHLILSRSKKFKLNLG